MNDPLQLAADLARRFEGLRQRPYQDQAGYWTIGYGSRALADRTAVARATRPISAAEADALLTDRLAVVQGRVRQLVTAPMTAGQEAALIDFSYNLGTSALAGSTLLRLLNQRAYVAAGAELARWNHVRIDGRLVESNGLTNRRRAELALWNTPSHSQPSGRVKALS
ncbi:lysozyme [Acetobacter sacchari]|uniref:Lysozyme n=1 Tax=Acetobacter sacchari TaxID=2661687 RepID=A0ABS3M064_9PROT|nr:lysozyme [Acetobacter sacchari]MBO1361544.1 lysozyme [Acetobacter sacchari]